MQHTVLNGERRFLKWFVGIGFFLLLWIAIGSRTLITSANPESPEVDNSSVVVDFSVEDFTISNGTIYWTYCAGDILDFSTFLMSQQLNDPSTKTALLEIQSTSCIDYRELLSDPAFIYYKNETDSRVEKRLFQTINSSDTLFTYTSANEPTGLALADGYIYWSAADKAIRRIPVLGGAIEKVTDTIGVPADISIDDENIWYGTDTALYWIKRDCSLPCTGKAVYNTNVKQLFAAGKAAPTYKAAVFWIANNKSSPDTVESYDCNVPNLGGCFHKTLYEGTTSFSVDSVSASDKEAFWLEVDTSTWTSSFLRRAPRDCKTPCSPTNIDTIVNPVQPKGDWYPSRMILDDVDIYFRHKGISKIAQDAAPLVWNIAYDGMEVTQAVQSLENDVPLVIDKPTYVRLYTHLTEGDDLVFPEAQLAGTYNGSPLPGSPLQPIKRPHKLSVGSTYDRDDMTTSWLFQLPREWTEKGTIELQAHVDPRKLYDATPPSSPLTSVKFTYRPPICVVALKVSQHGSTARHTDSSFQLAVRNASALLPTSDIWVYHQKMILEEGIWPFYSPYELPEDSFKLRSNIWLRDRFSNDPDDCDAAGARTIYSGMIHPNTYTGSINGSAVVGFDQNWTRLPQAGGSGGFGNAGWPLDGRESTFAHELGHNFDRWHVDCPVGSPADTEYYPYDTCVLSPATGPRVYYGFDSVLLEPIAPTEGSDLMSYNLPRWISDYTWEKIFNFNKPIPNLDLLPSAPDANNVLISGKIDISNPSLSELDTAWVMPAGTLGPALLSKWQEDAMYVSPQSPTAPRYYVRFIGIGNTVLADPDINLIPHSDDPDSDEILAFKLTTSAPSGLVVKLQLMADNTILDTLSPGLLLPQVSMTKPAWGTVVDQTLVVEWSASDPNGDELEFIVQFSPDLGNHWQTLATEITGTPDTTTFYATFDSSTLPGSEGLEALVRVIASDGYNTAVATSEKFLTVLKIPEVFITSPADGALYESGQTVTLKGSANDPEDGRLDPNALSWTLNTTDYGTGDLKQAAGLAPGKYDVKLTATDLDYGKSTASSTFTIAPWKIAEGKAKLDGLCTDPAYANTPHIILKPYSDGNQASVYAVRNDRYVWFCFSGLNKGSNYANSFVGVRLDGNYSRDTLAQPNDYAFFVRPNGNQFTKRGNGSGGYNDKPPSFVEYSLASKVSPDVGGNTWNAELRIEYYYASMGDHIGIDLGHYWVNFQGNDYHWPYQAAYNRPNTWAENYTTVPPKISQVSPEIIMLPNSGQTIAISGTNFQDGDRVLWDGKVLRTTFGSSSQMSAIVTSVNLTPGEHQIEVSSGRVGVKSNPVNVIVMNPTPVLNALTPDEVPAGSNNTIINVKGSNFVPNATVFWDGKPQNTLYIDEHTLKITVSGDYLTKSGARTIVVVNPDPTQGVSNKLIFVIAEGRIFLPIVIKP